MKQTFIVTIEAEDKITSKEVADCLNMEYGIFSLNFNHDNDIIVAKARKCKEERNEVFYEKNPKRSL